MFRDNGLSDFSPKSDIHRRDVVCRPSEAARLASKLISGWPIGLSYMPARWTCSRSVPGINKNHRNAGDLCLVINELSKQSEIPSMQAATLCLSNRNSGSNILEIFHRYSSQSVFGFRNYLLGNAMVDIFRKSCHPARKLLKMPFGRFRTFALEPGFQRIELVSGLIDLFSRMHFSIRIHRKVLDTKINAKDSFGIIRGLLRYFDHNAKVENAFDQNQISLASNPIHSGFLVISYSDGDKLPALESSKRNTLQALPGKDSLIINNSTIWPKLWFDGFVSFVSFADLGNGPDGELRRETKMFPDRIVNRLVDFNLVGAMQSKNRFCNAIAGFIEAMHGIQEHLILLFGWIKLNHHGLEHHTGENIQRVYTYRAQRKYFRSVPNSSRPLKEADLLGDIL
jgi:hypothetical protein